MAACMSQAQELYQYIITSSNFGRNIHKGLSELFIHLSATLALVRRKNVFSRVTHPVHRVVVVGGGHTCA